MRHQLDVPGGTRQGFKPISIACELVDFAGETVRRQPLGLSVRIEERPIHPLGHRAQHTVQPDGIPCHCRQRLATTDDALTLSEES